MSPFRSSARPKLVEASGFDSPARAELALAIAARDALRRGVANLWDAEMNYATFEYQDAADRANTALGLAKAAATAKVIDGALEGETAVLNSSAIRQARIDLQVAKDDLDAAREAHGQLRLRREKMEQDAQQADRKVADAAAAVVREHPAVSTILADYERARQQYLKTLGLIEWMSRENVLESHNSWGGRADTEQAQVVHAVLRHAPGPNDGGIKQVAAEPWGIALKALLTDAHTPLPERV